jgi:3-oxoacyl-[acyl-carrier-protein] synthase II
MSKSSDVVLTGLGPVTAIGTGVDEYWQSLLAGRSGVGCLDRRDDDNPRPAADWLTSSTAGSWLGAPIIGFDAVQFVRPRKALKVMGRELQTAFAASTLAMDQACVSNALQQGSLATDRIATIFGSQMFYGPESELREAVMNSRDEAGICQLPRFGSAAIRDIMPLWMLKYLPNMPACHVGIAIGATGANNTIVSGDVSATSALIESIGVLRRGIADVVICGGTGTLIDGTNMVYRGDLPVPSVADPIERSSRPHTVESIGVVGGEAAASLVLESAENAGRRGAQPIAVVSGVASRFAPPDHGARGSATAISRAIQGALSNAGLSAAEIGMVVSHGTGDPSRDAAERAALQGELPAVPLVMPIALVGYCGAAAGAINLVTAALALAHRMIPPSFLHGTPAPGWESCFADSPRLLEKNAVMVLTHTSQGVANAVVLSAPRQPSR